SLAHPLIAIALPADDMSPPLMSYFVRGYKLEEVCCVDPQRVALRAVEICRYRHVDKHRPCLTEIREWLLSHLYSTIRERPERIRIDLHRELGFGLGFIHQQNRIERLEDRHLRGLSI